MQYNDAIEKIIKSKKYSGVCADTVARVYAEALSRYTLKDAEKAARSKLHQITGAFMSPDEVKRAGKCLSQYKAGDRSALDRALSMHASTRERPEYRELYGRVFSHLPSGALALDLACGLNPLALGDMGLNVWACDISREAVDIVNDWARECGWNVEAHTLDLVISDVPKGDIALFMKLLPVIERQERGGAERVLKNTRAKWKFVTFPTKTLSGRFVGMEKQYAEWFEPMLEGFYLIDRFIADNELCYLLEDKNV